MDMNYPNITCVSGIGIYDLAAFLTHSTLMSIDKPLYIVLTHIHFDHSGGAGTFPLRPCDRLFIHPLESAGFSDPLQTVPWIVSSEIAPKPNVSWTARQYRVKAPRASHPILDGQELNLGGRSFKAMSFRVICD